VEVAVSAADLCPGRASKVRLCPGRRSQICTVLVCLWLSGATVRAQDQCAPPQTNEQGQQSAQVTSVKKSVVPEPEPTYVPWDLWRFVLGGDKPQEIVDAHPDFDVTTTGSEDPNFWSSVFDVGGNLQKLCKQIAHDISSLSQGSPGQRRNASPDSRPRALTGANRQSGQAALGLLVADLRGDGTPFRVYFTSDGVEVQQLNVSDGSVVSTNDYPVGFTPDTVYSTIIAADFNGDSKPDLAVSDPGEPGSDAGGVAVLLGNGDGTFQSAKSFPAGMNPGSLAAADFNGDTHMDLAAASTSGASIAVLTGDGQGNFGAPVSYTPGSNGAIPGSLLALDVNGDGNPDLIVASEAGAQSNVSTLINSEGSFHTGYTGTLPYSPEYLAYADLNNDGITDLIGVSLEASAVMVMFGNSGGTFQEPVLYAAGNSASSAAVVPNSDGSSFIATPDFVAPSMWFSLVTPQGVLGAPQLHLVGGFPTGIAVADLNGDGHPDAVVTGGSSDVSVLLSQNGVLQSAGGYSVGQAGALPQALAIGDVTNDGKPDVVVASQSGLVSVLPGNGAGAFAAARNTQVNEGAQNIALADLNRDGNLDAVVAAYGSQSGAAGADQGGVVVLLGNGDGTFRVQTPLTIPGLHASAVTVADLNGDGIPDLAAVFVSGIEFGKSTLAVYLGEGNGVFQAPRTFALEGANGSSTGVIGLSSGVVVGDWNGDGKPDIAAVSQADHTKIDVLLGDGMGNFSEMATLPGTEDSPSYLAAADVNSDGKPDLIVAHCCGEGDATYLLGNGDGTFQPELQLLGGNSPAAVSVASTPGGVTIYSANEGSAAVSAVTLSPPAATSVLLQLSSAAGGEAALAPGSLASAYAIEGVSLDTGQPVMPGLPWPVSQNGTTVTIEDSIGATTSAPLVYVSPTQVNFQIPGSVATGTATVTVTAGNGDSATAQATLTAIAPSLFTLNSDNLGAAYAECESKTGMSVEDPFQVVNGEIVAQPLNLGACDQTVLELLGTGMDTATAANLQVTIGGIAATVQSAGPAGGYPGLDQIDVVVPQSLAGRGNVQITVTAGGMASNDVNITIQ